MTFKQKWKHFFKSYLNALFLAPKCASEKSTPKKATKKKPGDINNNQVVTYLKERERGKTSRPKFSQPN